MRWVLFALLATGCQKLFSVQHVDDLPADAAPPVDIAPDGAPLRTCISDNFDSGTIDLTHYYVTQPMGGATAAHNGGVLISWPSLMAGDNYGSVGVSAKLDVRGGTVSVDVDDYAGDMAEGVLIVSLDDTHHVYISVNAQSVEFYLNDGGTADTKVAAMTYTQKPLTLQLANDLATGMLTYSFTNTNGTYAVPIAMPFSLQAVDIAFSGGSYGAATMAGAVQFDNFAVKSPFCF